MFPRLGAVRPRPRRPRSRVTPAVPPTNRVPGAAQTLSSGVVGILKRLSKEDAKGFRGEKGTPYIALPVALLSYFPTRPSGKNGEPRYDVPIVARLDSALNDPVASGFAPTNITGVGMGLIAKSHPDLRLNVLQVIIKGIEFIAQSNGVRVPKEGDYLLVEFPLSVPEVRLTFLTQAPLSARAAALLGRSRWAWLPGGSSPSW